MSRRALILLFISAGIAFAQAPSAPADLLARAREKILSSIRNLPKYTCLETIDRSYYVLPREKHSPHMMTEEEPPTACNGNAAVQLILDAKDRLRVEVAIAGEGEVHSWPGASRFDFDTRSFDQMIPFGPLSTGSFGPLLFDVFANLGAQIKFVGRKADGRGDVFDYSFRVPEKASHNWVKGRSGWDVTAYSGSFEINAVTTELGRLVIETDPLPPDSSMCQSKISTDYHTLRIGDGDFLLPRRSELETFDTNGTRTASVTRFSSCREYTAESSIRFDGPDASAESVAAPPPVATLPSVGLPAGVSLTLALDGALDLSTAAAGDPVSARVVHSVRARGSKEILVPAGSIARGRLLVVRHELSTSDFLISVHFNTLERKGAVSPLSIRLVREVKAEKRNAGALSFRGTEFSLPLPTVMQPGSHLVFRAKSGNYVIQAGYESKWITVAP